MFISGSAWSTHHMALLIGYGASAIVPYTAYDAVLVSFQKIEYPYMLIMLICLELAWSKEKSISHGKR